MPFPLSEMSFGGTYALIITLNNAMRIYRVTPIYGRIFYVADLGIFLLDEEYRYILNNRAEVYFFTQKGCNPLSLKALVDIVDKLKVENPPRKELELKDLALFVDKIRKVEIQKNLIQRLQSDPNTPMTDADLQTMLADGSFDYTVEKMSQMAKPKSDKAEFEEATINWLNAYFKEDVVSRFYLMMREITDDKFKLKESKLVHNIMPLQTTTGKKNIALVIINNSRIEVDPTVKVEMNYNEGIYELKTKKYGTFKIREAKTRYKYGRQNIFIVMVDTTKKVEKKQEDKIAA